MLKEIKVLNCSLDDNNYAIYDLILDTKDLNKYFSSSIKIDSILLLMQNTQRR